MSATNSIPMISPTYASPGSRTDLPDGGHDDYCDVSMSARYRLDDRWKANRFNPGCSLFPIGRKFAGQLRVE